MPARSSFVDRSSSPCIGPNVTARCEAVGSGPISVFEAWALAREAIIEALLTDGDDVMKIHRFDRHVPAALLFDDADP